MGHIKCSRNRENNVHVSSGIAGSAGPCCVANDLLTLRVILRASYEGEKQSFGNFNRSRGKQIKKPNGFSSSLQVQESLIERYGVCFTLTQEENVGVDEHE